MMKRPHSNIAREIEGDIAGSLSHCLYPVNQSYTVK